MKRCGAALAVAFAAIVLAVGCNDYGNTFQVPTGARITALSPSTISAGSTQFTLTVTGAGFVKQTVVQWNGKTLPTNVPLDSNGNLIGNTITATVDASFVTTAGTAFVNTFQPHSGAGTNGLSNPLAFVITPPPNPVPVVSSISPSCTVAGGGSLTVTVTGSSFLPPSDPSGGSQVRWTAGATQTTLALVGTGTTTQVQATVTANLIAMAGSATVSVFNPPAPQSGGGGSGGGGTSQNAPTFTIAASSCPPGTTARPVSAVTHAAEEAPSVSADGRYVAYTAVQDERTQVLLHDTCVGAAQGCQVRTLLVSTAADGSAGNADSRSPSLSADGRYVAFSSAATNLTLAEEGATGRQVYLRDTCFGATASCAPSTVLVSTDEEGKLSGTEAILPSISASGRFVAFVAITPSHTKVSRDAKSSENATPNSGFRQVFVRDTCLGATSCTPSTTRISLQPGDAPASNSQPAGPALSGSGEHVALSGAQDLTLFHRATPVDDRIFLTLTKQE